MKKDKKENYVMETRHKTWTNLNEHVKKLNVAYLELYVSRRQVLLADDGVVREGPSGVDGVSESLLDVGVGGGAAPPTA